MYNGTLSHVVTAVAVLTLRVRYFEDSVRDDYAAGQLDAQVCHIYFYEVVSYPSVIGRRRAPGDEGVVDMWGQLGPTFPVVHNAEECMYQYRPIVHADLYQFPTCLLLSTQPTPYVALLLTRCNKGRL